MSACVDCLAVNEDPPHPRQGKSTRCAWHIDDRKRYMDRENAAKRAAAKSGKEAPERRSYLPRRLEVIALGTQDRMLPQVDVGYLETLRGDANAAASKVRTHLSTGNRVPPGALRELLQAVDQLSTALGEVIWPDGPPRRPKPRPLNARYRSLGS